MVNYLLACAAPSLANENVAVRHELTHLHESRGSLMLRVAKIRTGLLQTENPPSRTVRLISNVQVEPAADAVTQDYSVRSAFLLYRQRRQRQVEILAGHRPRPLDARGRGLAPA